MGVTIAQNAPSEGFVRLSPGEFLAYSLTPEPVPDFSAVYVFTCLHHRHMIQERNGLDHVFHWFLGPPPPGASAPAFGPDVAPGVFDAYLVGLQFTSCPTYRLQIVHWPERHILRDCVFKASNRTDVWTDQFGAEFQ
jgi:hypothetical protein